MKVHSFKKGDRVTVFQISNAGLLVEGLALVESLVSDVDEYYTVRFWNKRAHSWETETYERFIDRDGQDEPEEYIKSFNKKFGIGRT